MSSEIRANTLKNRVGLSTINITNTGIVVSGVATATSFVGNLTGNATGLSGTPNISCGTIAGSTGTFSGNLNVAQNIVHTGDTDTKIEFLTNNICFDTAGSERVRITSSQTRIGSQAATDTTSFEIQLSGAANNDAILSLYNPTTNNGEGIHQGFFFKNSNDTVTEFARIKSTAIETTAATAKGDLRFYTRSGSGGISNSSERLRIGSSGQIGIAGANYGTSGQFLKSTGSGSAVVWANAGVTMADQWMLTSNFSPGGAVSIVTSGWGQVSRAGYGSIGSSMTQSSGVFTYPQTGIYFVEYTAQLISTSAQRYLGGRIQTTHNNSSYAHAADVNTHCGITNSFGTYSQITCSVIQDVQDVTQDKVRFCAVAFTPSDTTLQGDANRAATHVTFIRLGDT